MKKIYADWSPFIAFVLLGVCLLLMFKRCDSPRPALTAIPEMKVRDSFRTVVRYYDSTRTKVIKRYRNISRLVDSVACYTVVAACDTVIKVDSVLISALKGQVSNDSVIIFKQSLMLRADSVYIGKLNKKIRRNKAIAKIAFVTGLISGGIVGVRVVR